MFFKKHFFTGLLVILLLNSCSDYGKLIKSKDLGLKYKRAIEYYNNEDYIKAYPLFEELITVYRGTKKAERLYYYYAYCEYYLGDYVMAGHHFKEFTRRFPTSKYTEECQFLNAFCYFKNSPISSLDQTNTIIATRELQLFANLYPGSTRLDSCNHLIDILRNKLEKKAFDNAYLYYHMRDYKSAIQDFENMIKDYPDTKYKEECMFLIIKSNYQLALKSVDAKKIARLDNTIKAATKFINQNIQSQYLDEVRNIQAKAMKLKEDLAYTLSEKYYDEKKYEKTIELCEDALKRYPDHENKPDIMFLLVNAQYMMSMKGNIRFRKPMLDKTIETIEKMKDNLGNSNYMKQISELEKNAKLELSKLPMSVPYWYLQHGNYNKAIEMYTALASKESALPKQSKLSFLLYDAYYKQAQAAQLNKKQYYYKLLIDKYDSLLYFIDSSEYAKQAASIDKKVKSEYEKLPFIIPMKYYRSKKYNNAIKSFHIALDQYPDYKKKLKFSYLIMKAGYLNAKKTKNRAMKVKQFSVLIADCSNRDENLINNKFDRLCNKCLKYKDELTLEPLIKEYRLVLYEKRNFAVHTYRTLNLYKKIKPELLLQKNKARADKIYKSTIKLKSKTTKLK